MPSNNQILRHAIKLIATRGPDSTEIKEWMKKCRSNSFVYNMIRRERQQARIKNKLYANLIITIPLTHHGRKPNNAVMEHLEQHCLREPLRAAANYLKTRIEMAYEGHIEAHVGNLNWRLE